MTPKELDKAIEEFEKNSGIKCTNITMPGKVFDLFRIKAEKLCEYCSDVIDPKKINDRFKYKGVIIEKIVPYK